jgi:hypothetical protein
MTVQHPSVSYDNILVSAARNCVQDVPITRPLVDDLPRQVAL